MRTGQKKTLFFFNGFQAKKVRNNWSSIQCVVECEVSCRGSHKPCWTTLSFMLFQQYNAIKGDLEGGGLMKALIDGVVHSAGLVQVLTVGELIG